MTDKQPEAMRLVKILESFSDNGAENWVFMDSAAAELRRLHKQNSELLEALRMNAQALAWLANGKCRGFHAKLPTANDALDAARAAIEALEKQPWR